MMGETALDVAKSKPYSFNNYDPVIEYLDDITKNLNKLVVQQVSSVHQECEALLKNNRNMTREQCQALRTPREHKFKNWKRE